MATKRNPHEGSSFDDFLKEEGIYDEVNTAAIKRVLTWKIEKAIKKKRITKSIMARRMKTSRAQLDRLLDPDNSSVTLTTLARAASVLGKNLRLDLVER